MISQAWQKCTSIGSLQGNSAMEEKSLESGIGKEPFPEENDVRTRQTCMKIISITKREQELWGKREKEWREGGKSVHIQPARRKSAHRLKKRKRYSEGSSAFRALLTGAGCVKEGWEMDEKKSVCVPRAGSRRLERVGSAGLTAAAAKEPHQ